MSPAQPLPEFAYDRNSQHPIEKPIRFRVRRRLCDLTLILRGQVCSRVAIPKLGLAISQSGKRADVPILQVATIFLRLLERVF